MKLEDVVHVSVTISGLQVAWRYGICPTVIDDELELLAKHHFHVHTESSFGNLFTLYLSTPCSFGPLVCELSKDLYALNFAEIKIVCLKKDGRFENTTFPSISLELISAISILYLES